MNTDSSVRPARGTNALMLWLASGLVVAGLYTWTHLNLVQLGLGWSVSPGFVVLFLTITLGAMELRAARWLNIIQVLLCLIAATLLEYVEFTSRLIDSFVGIALTLFGMTILFTSVRNIRVPEVMFLLVSSYIQSVCLYNLFAWGQMMHFFKPGWIF